MRFVKIRWLFPRFLNRRLKLGVRESEFLWIMGAMRSGSSLLTHLLINHPDIEGFGESWTRYNTHRDFRELLARTLAHSALDRSYRRKHQQTNRKIVLDKLLHDELLPNQDLLNTPGLNLIFLLRQPRDVIVSLLRAGKPFPYSGSPEEAAGYFRHRMWTLNSYAQKLQDPSRAMIVHYESLLTQPRANLDRLQEFLQLEQPLSESYEVHVSTGIPFIGDPSRLIKSGKVLRKKKSHKPPVDIPQALLEACDETYRSCLDDMKSLGIPEASLPAAQTEAGV